MSVILAESRSIRMRPFLTSSLKKQYPSTIFILRVHQGSYPLAARILARCCISRVRATEEPCQPGYGDEEIVFNNLQSQDDPKDKNEELERPLSFVLDDCPFGPGFIAIAKSMCKGEMCRAWLGPMQGPGESTIVSKRPVIISYIVVDLFQDAQMKRSLARARRKKMCHCR